MKNNRKGRAVFEEPSYWQSFSDMMAALLLIFILIIAITLMIYRQKTVALEATRLELNAAQIELEQFRKDIEASNLELAASLEELQIAYANAAKTQEELDEAYAEIDLARQELEDAYLELDEAYLEMELTQDELNMAKSELEDIVGIRTDIIGELQTRFNNTGMTVDPQTGSITFSSDVLFAFNSATLTESSRESLKEVIPMYLGVLLQDEYRKNIAEIIIEGHTDTKGTYQSNQTLSYNRANAVANFCLKPENGLSDTKIAQLQSLLTVNGRSYSDPVYEAGSMNVDMDASRRVEIKFRLKEDEMIDKIARILDEDEED